MPLRPACPGTEIARAPHSRRARDLRGVGSPEGSGLFGRRPAARKEAGAAPAVSRCMGQQGAVARGGGLGRPPSRSARQAERARGPGSSQQAEEDICAYCGAGGTPLCIRHTPPYRYKYRGRYSHISHLLDIPARPDKPKRRDRPTIAARSASVRPHAAASRTVQTGMCRRSTAGFSVASRALAACRC